MTPRNRFVLAGATLMTAALIGLLATLMAYWPFQSVVQVIAPFLLMSILVSVGSCLVLVAFLLPAAAVSRARESDSLSAVDALLSEVRRR